MTEDFAAREQEIWDRLYQAGFDILINARNELYIHMRFLDVALSSFQYQMDMEMNSLGTDGNVIYYNARFLGGLFRESRTIINRAYLHQVLHCLFCHVVETEKREEIYWNLACDIAVESIIDSMQIRCLKKGMSWLRESTYRELGRSLKVLTAEGIYLELQKMDLGVNNRKLDKLILEFCRDSHQYWNKQEDSEKNSEMNQKWQDIREQMEMDLDTFSKESVEASGGLRDQLKVCKKQGDDYRRFLRKFSVLKEEIQVDTDQFDYAFYTYGMTMYGNMPLIEPVESKEVMKIEEFAIVIDTSMSCSGHLVRLFLEENYHILQENDSFFRKVNIHIIQCDEKVQQDRKITTEEELQKYMEEMEIVGSGGTDFRPAFAYVDELCRRKEFTNLKGLLYFTDGFGIFPKNMPPYETAFVFMREDYDDTQVPPWAIKIIIDEEELSNRYPVQNDR